MITVDDRTRLAIRGRPLTAPDRAVLEAAAGQAVLALRQQRAADQALVAQRRAETTELRLSAADTAELLAVIEDSTDRLTGLVANLLDSSRLAAGAVRPILVLVGYDEVVTRALSTVDRSAAVAVEIAEDLPPVLAEGSPQ